MKLLSIVFLMMIQTAAIAATPSLSPDVKEGLERMVARGDARAVAVALYVDREIGFFGFGQVSRSDDSAPDNDTLFEIGSVSKVFTSLLTQVQVDAERLDWDAPIRRYLTGLHFADNKVASVTLRQLATHTSGLPRLPDNMQFEDPLDPYAGYDRSDLMSFLSAHDPKKFDRDYEYSNLGAGLLGVIAADAAELDYADAMQRDVLLPLQMVDTSVGVPSGKTKQLAVGFSDGADMPNWGGFDALAGAGALVSTSGDMIRFIQQNFEPDALKDALAAIRKPQGSGETGLGWHVEKTDDGERIIWHNGGTGGYASFVGFRPDNKTGVVILTASTDTTTVTELGFTAMTGQASATVGVNLDRYSGAYKIAEGFILTIFIEDSRLMGQATGQAAFPLTPTDLHEFSFAAADIRIVFDVEDSVQANSLTLYQRGNASPAPRVSDDQGMQARKEIDLDPASLADYSGRFQLAAGAILTVEARGAQLFVQLTGQAAYPVFAYERDKFFYKIVDAQLYFERDENNEVVAVTLNQAGQRRAPRIE